MAWVMQIGRKIKTTHQEAAPYRGRSLVSTITFVFGATKGEINVGNNSQHLRAGRKVAAFVCWPADSSATPHISRYTTADTERCFTLHYVRPTSVFTRDSIYAIARICHRNSVCLSVRHTGGSVKSV